MTRVAVIGNAAGGKSTMCRALSAATGLPHYPIDQIQWKPGWLPTPKEEFDAKHDSLIDQDKWIIDGFGPWESVKRRLEAADTVVFVDQSLWRHYWWAAKRQLKSIVWERPDGPEGCPMLPATLRLFRMMWSLHWKLRPKLLEAIERQDQSKTFYHLRSPKQLAEFRQCHCGNSADYQT